MVTNVIWHKDILHEMLDQVVLCYPAAKIAEHMTRKFRMKFTANMILGKMNREFGGILIFLINYAWAWPDEAASKDIRRMFEERYGVTLPLTEGEAY